VSQLRCSQFSQFVIDQRQQFFSGLRIALLNLREDARDVGHGYEDSQPEALTPENAYCRTFATSAKRRLSEFQKSQEQRFERLGGNDTLLTDVRLIAATNQNLEELIAQQRFRGDLFYRLKVVTIYLPALRERRDDLPHLAQRLLERLRRQLKLSVERIDEKTFDLLASYDWPGNVRELEGVLKESVLRCSGPVLSPDDVALCLRRSAVPRLQTGIPEMDRSRDMEQYIAQRLAEGSTNLHTEALAHLETHLIPAVLAHTKGNQVQAAKILGIARNSLRKKLTAIENSDEAK